MANVLPVTVWSVVRSLPVCRWQVKLVDDFSRVVIRLSQDVTKHSTKQWHERNSDLLIGYKIRPVHPFDNPMDVGGDVMLRGYVLTLYSST